MKKKRETYPSKAITVLKFDQIIRKEKENLADRLSTRMVRSAVSLSKTDFIGWQILAPSTGLVEMGILGSKGVTREDLEWMSENTANISIGKMMYQKEDIVPFSELYELYLPVRQVKQGHSIGFLSDEKDYEKDGSGSVWPVAFSDQFAELINAFRVSGACFRATFGAASSEEREECRKVYLNIADLRSISAENYL